jgi:hypothetical protein
MGRHEKRVAQAHHRASVARFRREAEGTLRTYLVAPDDAELDSIPILKRATRSWLDNLKSNMAIVALVWQMVDIGIVVVTVVVGVVEGGGDNGVVVRASGFSFNSLNLLRSFSHDMDSLNLDCVPSA